MPSLFRALLDRLKAYFAVAAAQELELEVQVRQAERQAELLRLAERYERDGLTDVALKLRQQAAAMGTGQPLALVMPAVQHLLVEAVPTPSPPALTHQLTDGKHASPAASQSRRSRKRR